MFQCTCMFCDCRRPNYKESATMQLVKEMDEQQQQRFDPT